MRMTKEVFIANGKFYLENPFKKNNKQNETVGKASLLCNGWRFRQVNNFTLVEEIDSDIYYKFPSKDGVICICGKQVTNKVVYYRKKSLYLFLKENKITTIQRCNAEFEDVSFNQEDMMEILDIPANSLMCATESGVHLAKKITESL